MLTAYDDVHRKRSSSTLPDNVRLHDLVRELHTLYLKVDRLRELVRDLHSLYIKALDDLERMDEANIWEYSDDVEKDLVQSKTVYDDLRHRFDDVMRELGIEV